MFPPSVPLPRSALLRPLTGRGITDAILPGTMALGPRDGGRGREQCFKGSVNLPWPLGAIATPSETWPRLLAALWAPGLRACEEATSPEAGCLPLSTSLKNSRVLLLVVYAYFFQLSLHVTLSSVALFKKCFLCCMRHSAELFLSCSHQQSWLDRRGNRIWRGKWT